MLFQNIISTPFFYKQHFYKQHQGEISKNQAKAKKHPQTKLLLFENYLPLSSIFSSKANMSYSKKMCKNKCTCFNDIIWLIIMKIRLKMNNRSHRYDINRTRPRYSYNYTKYKICLSMMMIMCNKQHLSYIWSWIDEKV